MNFSIEILIHDDASSDETPEIIREYQARYPQVIKPILRTENQYSKGISNISVFNFPRARGKYIAMCEGDDYWIDPGKLQAQVDYLEAVSYTHLQQARAAPRAFFACIKRGRRRGPFCVRQARAAPGALLRAPSAGGSEGLFACIKRGWL